MGGWPAAPARPRSGPFWAPSGLGRACGLVRDGVAPWWWDEGGVAAVVVAPAAGVLQRGCRDCPDPLGSGRAGGGLAGPCCYARSAPCGGGSGSLLSAALRLSSSPVSPRPISRSCVGGLSETVKMVRCPLWHRLVGGLLGGALPIVLGGGGGFGAGEISGGSFANGVAAPVGVAGPS